MPELPFLNPTSEPRLVAANGGRPPLLTVQVVRAPDPRVAFGNGYLAYELAAGLTARSKALIADEWFSIPSCRAISRENSAPFIV